MAVHDSAPGIEVTVESGGTTLQEYPDNDDTTIIPKVKKSYIEAPSDQTFAVKIVTTPEFHFRTHAVVFEVEVDGLISQLSMQREARQRENPDRAYTTLIKGHERSIKGSRYLQEFTFSELTLGDDDAAKDVEEARRVGTIFVKIHRVVESGPERDFGTSMVPRGVQSMSEKAVKGSGVSHCVSLGKEIAVANRRCVPCSYTDGFANPFATFEFKYRSRKALQQLLVIPRSPSPEQEVPLEERPLESLTIHEKDELIRRMRARNAESDQSLKRERVEVKPQTSGGSRSKKPRTAGNIDVIDLCDESD
ncbi:MAG: hypothetical protein M4579_000586 [Chaenotheca gracillima]|nr:MAG: hypothetical protein M4579_000586 [Chaenotheca gracillima]